MRGAVKLIVFRQLKSGRYWFLIGPFHFTVL